MYESTASTARSLLGKILQGAAPSHKVSQTEALTIGNAVAAESFWADCCLIYWIDNMKSKYCQQMVIVNDCKCKVLIKCVIAF